MNNSLSARRMADNEVVFRKYNESIQHGLTALKQVAKEDNQEDLVDIDDTPLHFYCECSDENCHQRILLTPDAYEKLHKERDYFIVIPGHETKSIEKTVARTSAFAVVKKMIQPSEKADTLQMTDVNNS